MKNKISKKIISLFLAVTMIVTTLSVAFISSASSAVKTHPVITPANGYDVVDNPKFSSAQQYTMFMDFLDDILETVNFQYKVPVINKDLDAHNFDTAMNSLQQIVTGLNMTLVGGDIKGLLESPIDALDVLRRNQGDEKCVDAILTFLKNSNIDSFVSKLFTIDSNGKNGINWGSALTTFAGENVTKLNIVEKLNLKATINNAMLNLVPANVQKPTLSGTIDANLFTVLNVALPAIFNNLNKDWTYNNNTKYKLGTGFTLNYTDSLDQVVDKFAKFGINFVLIGMQEWTKNWTYGEGPYKGQPIIPADKLAFTPYAFGSGSVISQLNDLIGYIGGVLEKDTFKFDSTKTWQANLATLIGAVLKDTSIVKINVKVVDIKGDGLDLNDYIAAMARAALKQYVPQLTIPEGATLKDMADIGMRELLKNYLPDTKNIDAMDYKQCIYTLAMNVIPKLIDPSNLNISGATDFDSLVKACMDKLVSFLKSVYPNINGPATTADHSIAGYLVAIISPFLPASLKIRNADGSLADGASITKEFEAVLNGTSKFDVLDVYKILRINPKAMDDVMTLVKNLINNYAESGHSSGALCANVTTFDSLLSYVDGSGNKYTNLATFASRLLSNIPSTSVKTGVIPIVMQVVGYASNQAKKAGSISCDSQIALSDSTTIKIEPDLLKGLVMPKITIKNNSTGMPRYYTDSNGQNPTADKGQYMMKIISVTCDNPNIKMTDNKTVDTSNKSVSTTPFAAGFTLRPNESAVAYLSGNVKSDNSIVTFTMDYKMTNEDGTTYGPTLESKAYAFVTDSSVTTTYTSYSGLDTLVNQILSANLIASDYDATAYASFSTEFVKALALVRQRASDPGAAACKAELAKLQPLYTALLKTQKVTAENTAQPAVAVADKHGWDVVDYTPKSLLKFLFAYFPAKMSNAQTSPFDIEENTRQLNRFLPLLDSGKRASSLTWLTDAITKANALTQSDYTADSWAALAAAKNNANTVVTGFDPSTTLQSKVNTAKNDINSAINSLKANVQPVKTITDGIDKLAQGDYTSDSWNALQTLKTQALNAITDPDISVTDVKSWESQLNTGISQLKKFFVSADPTIALSPSKGLAVGTGLMGGKTVEAVKAQISSQAGTVVIQNADGSAADPKAKVGTGLKIAVVNDNKVVASTTIVIYGDVTGDGNANLADFTMFKEAFCNNQTVLENLDKSNRNAALDVNHDGVYDIADVMLMDFSLNNFYTIKQNIS